MPGAESDVSQPGARGRKLPPELGPQPIAVLDGTTFMYSDAAGDVPPGSIGGLVHSDTRFINRWVLTINGERLLPLRSGEVDHYSAAFFLTNGELPGLPPHTVGVRRLRFVGNGLHERVELQSSAADPVHLALRLEVGSDFADLFEIKDVVRDRSTQTQREHPHNGTGLTFVYRNNGFEAETDVNVSPPATRVDGDTLVWEIDLVKGYDWYVDIHIPLKIGPSQVAPGHKDFGEAFGAGANDPASRWFAQLPTLQSDSALLTNVVRKATLDLVALRIENRVGDQFILLPAAGLPWFLTLFGRDTIITAYQTVCFGPQLARGALLALAEQQGRERNDFRDEEPGKILHEFRNGELTQLGIMPHRPYYGTADATMLWLILLSEYWRWTGDDALVHTLRDHALAALEWIDRFGDRDGDGYVEYGTRSSQGLGNQCWRDSWDGVQFSDGSIPVLPIATCELQGYVYDAKIRVAELTDGPLGDAALGLRLRSEAQLLRERFNRDFWIDQRGGYYAVGLDGDKRKIDSMTSNMGQLLWSGIVPDDRARIVARQLMSDSMFSGWGVRTLSTQDGGFNPIGYHLGTVWPHDNALIALGLAQYGFREEANRISLALLDAASFTDYRLPEAFSGYDRSVGRFPVPYPTACSPQAWASGAPLVLVRAMLGLEARDGHLVTDPEIPNEIGNIVINKTIAFDRPWNIEAVGATGYARLVPREAGDVRA